MRMLGRWSSLEQGQVVFAGNCGCCDESGSTNVKKMEQPILDYLERKYRKAGSANLTRLLAEQAGYRQGEAGGIARLLHAIGRQAGVDATAAEQHLLLADLERSIEALAAMP